MERILSKVNWGLVFVILVLSPAVLSHAQSGKQWQVAGVALPLTTAAAPSTIQGDSLAAISVVVNSVVLTNTDTASQTVSIVDCQVAPFYLLKDAVIPAKTTWTMTLSGTRMQGCFKWVTTDVKVMGAASGTR